MIKETLGLDTRPYEQGLARAQGATINYMGKARIAFAQFGAGLTLAFGIRALKSLTDFAEQLKDVNSEASKSAKAFRDIATEQDISRVARMGKSLDDIWTKLKLKSIAGISTVVSGMQRTKAITVGPEREKAIAQLQSERQLRAEDPTERIGLINRMFNSSAQNAAADRAERLIRERAGQIFDSTFNEEVKRVEMDNQRLRNAQKQIELNETANQQWKTSNEIKARGVDLEMHANNAAIIAEEKKLELTRERVNLEISKLTIINDAAGKYLDRIDRARFSLDELAGGGPGISSKSKQGARRVQGLERRAKAASSRGNDAEAQRLLAQADQMRNTIPGLKTSEQGFGKTDSEKLAEISNALKGVAAKFGVAGGGGTKGSESGAGRH